MRWGGGGEYGRRAGRRRPQEGGKDRGCQRTSLLAQSLPRLSRRPAQPGPGPPPCASRGSSTPKQPACLLHSASPSPSAPGQSLPLLQGEPRVISVLFRAGRLPPSQLVCLQAARSQMGATHRPSPPPPFCTQAPHLGQQLHASLSAGGLLGLSQAQPPVSPPCSSPSSAPSLLNH